MSRAKFNHPDLDVLDSPIEASPLTSALHYVPGSALADMIFNDPESWNGTEDDSGDIPEDVDDSDPITWLVEEIEKIKAVNVDSNNLDLPSDVKDRDSFLLVPEPKQEILKGGKRGSVRPISLAALFERPGDNFSQEIQGQLSRILESGGIPHHIRPLSSSAITSGTPSAGTPSTGQTSSSTSTLHTPFQPHSASSIASTIESDISPIVVHSASATLSFLEWYGIYPDSPGQEVTRKLSMVQRKRTMKSRKTPPTPGSVVSRPPSMLGSNAHTPVVQTLLKEVSTAAPSNATPSSKRSQYSAAQSSTPVRLPPAAPNRSSPIPRISTPSGPSPPRRTSPIKAQSPPIPRSTTPVVRPPVSSRRTPSPHREPLPQPPAYNTTPSPPPRKSSVDISPHGIRRLPSLPPDGSSLHRNSSSLPSINTSSIQNLTRAPSRSESPAPTSLALPSSPPPGTGTISGGVSSAMTPSSFGMTSMGNQIPQSSTHPGPQRSSVRSPLGGPAGPRTRTSQRKSQRTSQACQQDSFAARVMSTNSMGNRLAGLRS